MRHFHTNFPCNFHWTTLSSHLKSGLKLCASIQMLIRWERLPQYSSGIKLSKYTGFQLNHLLLTAGEQDWERKPLLFSVIF
ncbi:hypothetical protein SLEP1_g41814 [Rubroshorea leprosula]|uniref:Uncharacterized protein n=1 Tax=Rubroshorea leprosula TaxID=152421 RepID=A0AAV5L7S6_9ROSI|nr:hypothetical protein SLEP1_g41814 [Rubroshorea leprosula]